MWEVVVNRMRREEWKASGEMIHCFDRVSTINLMPVFWARIFLINNRKKTQLLAKGDK